MFEIDKSSLAWLEALKKEMMSHWKVEQKINAILPVHNIGTLSLDTVALKNSLKAEARAWKSLYGKQLISHAGSLIAQMDEEIAKILETLKQPARVVEEYIDVHTAMSEAEFFDKKVSALPTTPVRPASGCCHSDPYVFLVHRTRKTLVEWRASSSGR